MRRQKPKEQKLLRQKNIILGNYDIDKIESAEEFIYIEGIRKNFGEGKTEECLNDAITDVVTEFEN